MLNRVMQELRLKSFFLLISFVFINLILNFFLVMYELSLKQSN